MEKNHAILKNLLKISWTESKSIVPPPKIYLPAKFLSYSANIVLEIY